MKKLVLSLFVLLTVAFNAIAQERTITGVVIDKEMGKPLPGVTVRLRGAQGSVQTESNGRYTIKAPASATAIEFTFLGYTTVTKTLANAGSTIDVVLVDDAEALSEVVVTGYGTGRPVGTIVGSVATVSSRVVESKPTANAFDALQGQVAGLQLFSSNGEPSVASSLRLHGVGSLGASNTPLILLDGMQIDQNVIVSLNPNDFETISVLKDASATSIYGARAANGVIYITTKKGRVGQNTISVQQQYSQSSVAYDKYLRNVMNTQQLSEFQIAQGLRTRAATDALLAQYPNDFQWFDYYHKKGVPTYQTDFNISGGANKTNYYISGSYLDAEGVRYRSAYDRYTIRANVNTEISNYLKAGLILSAGTDNRQLNGWGSNSTNGGLALLSQPWFSPYKADGSQYYGETIAGLGRYAPNYLADMMPDDYNRIQFNPSAYLALTPIKNLTLKTQGGMDGTIERNTWGTRPIYANSPGNGSLDESYSRGIVKTWTNTGEYKFNFGQNNFTALLGHEYVDGTTNSFSAGTAGSPFDNMWLLQNGNATNRRASSGKAEYSFNSLFGRLEYNFNNRYYLDASVREDKSSRFGADRQAATFWSIGGMWRMKEESFLKDVSWLDDMSLRASHGTSGNSSIGNYEHLALASTTTNYTNRPSFAISQAGNPDLGWEKQTKTTVGLTTGFFNRVRLTVEYYFRETTDQLINVPQPFTTGWANIRYNIGTLQNRYRWKLTQRNLRVGDFVLMNGG
ncbi:MAG: SusC/RagA family TonB-linked outer membrane protein, partial [Pedobacter sp.]